MAGIVDSDEGSCRGGVPVILMSTMGEFLSLGVLEKEDTHTHMIRSLLYSRPASWVSGCGWPGRVLTQPLGSPRPPLKAEIVFFF